jgi:hypothetical protein
MPKDKVTPENPVEELADPFVGGEDDDLMDMEYVQDEDTTTKIETHPPETKEEADNIESLAEAEEESKEDVKAEEEDEAAPEEAEEEEVLEAEEEEAPKVPKDRFDEVNERMKKAEAKLEEMEAKLQQPEEIHEEPEPEPYDYTAKEKEAVDAILEGDTERYAEIQAEIRAALRDETLHEAKKIAVASDQEIQETATFEEVGAQIEANFPELAINSENYNEEARAEMLDLFVGYAQSGMYSRVDALKKAADQVSKIYTFESQREEVVGDDKVVNIKKGKPKAKAKVANSQPPSMEGNDDKDNSEPKRDIQNMSDEEFDSLPESSKARMRGDIL